MTALQNKTALVTGASRGIGRATAAALAEAGAHVLVHYGRSAQEAESLVAEIQTKGGRADAISADLGTPDGASLLAKQVRNERSTSLTVRIMWSSIVLPLKSRLLQRPFRHWVRHRSRAAVCSYTRLELRFLLMLAVDQPTLGWRQAQDKGIDPMVSDDIQPSAAPEDKPSAQRFRPPPLCEAAGPAVSE